MESVYRDYLDDLDPTRTGVFPKLSESGHSEPDQLSRWFSDLAAIPLLILQSSAPVGFAMVTRATGAGVQELKCYRIAEFFIVRSHRRLGIGARAVELILDRFAGRWEILEYLRNPAAVKFWRRVVSSYTGGRFEERVHNGEVRHTFASRPAPRASAR